MIHLPLHSSYRPEARGVKEWALRLFAPRHEFWVALPGALLGTVATALVYFFLIQQQAVQDALFLREVLPRPSEHQLIAIATLGQTMFLGTGPALLFAIFESRGRRIWALSAYALTLWLSLFFLIVDLRVYLLHGRHLLQILAYAALPEGRQAAGSAWLWAARFAIWALQAALLCGVGVTASLLGARGCSTISSRRVRQLVTLALALSTSCAGPISVDPGSGWVTLGLHSRLLGVLPISFGAEHATYTRLPEDPIQAKLQRGLATVYQEKFAHLFRKRGPTTHAQRPISERPNVVLILVESLRADALTPTLMPRLHAWGQHGLRRSKHYAGTNFSESGTFAILYGLNPLVYHAVLDSRVPPPLCDGLRALSYNCAYYTGHPTVWWRREEFLGPETFDIHVRAQQGPWSDWDQQSLSALVELTKSARAGGYFGMTFLMSTHYEYRYPPEFERHRPADEPAVGWNSKAAEDFISTANRYKNAVGFVDHLIGDALSAIDTSQHYVIVTGDHAEALGEQGRLGHGFDFSDRLVHVPFVMRGPGIDPQEVSGLSLHQDIWPTVLSLVTGSAPEDHDLRLEATRRGTLLAHCEFNQKRADALLFHDDRRVRLKLALDSPELSVQGFEDADGIPIPSPQLSDAEIAALIAAFGTYLEDAAKPIVALP